VSNEKQLLLRGSRRQRVTRWQRRFLQCLRVCPDISRACSKAGISRQTAYRTREQDPEFASLWAAAISEAVENLEALVFRKAAEGDTQLATWLLRAHKPEVYRERQEHAHAFVGKIVLIPARAAGDE
jgi:hypothetical protein